MKKRLLRASGDKGPPRRGPGRPPKPKAERRVRIDVTIHPYALSALDALVEVTGSTRSATIERAIWSLYAAHPREDEQGAYDST